MQGKQQRYQAFQNENKKKSKTNWLWWQCFHVFFPQEYQHVYHLWFKKRSFTLAWKPNPPSAIVSLIFTLFFTARGAHLHASAKRGEYKPGSTPEALLLTAPLFTWRVKSDSCYNVPRLRNTRCKEQTLWSSADHALAQMRPRQIWTRTFSKKICKCNHFGCSLEPWTL